MPEIDDITQALEEQIEAFRFRLEPVSVGTVNEVGDGIVRISGLHDVMVGEMLTFSDGTIGMALNLEADAVGAVVLGAHDQIIEGSTVRANQQVVSVPVGTAMLGRVVNALGEPIDGLGPIRTSRRRSVESAAPTIIDRSPIDTPLQTGIKAVDALVPIGRGQRELIIGDRQTGKTTIAIDTIINQHADDVLCVYVAIGQKLSSVAQVVNTLRKHNALEHTVIVVAEASASAALQYLAPYAGAAIGEDLMHHNRDVLVVYDDLTKHAWAYRQISLLLQRPPGREAFPGDIFYLHARLLERAGKLKDSLGGGSLTALPIIETQMGDMAAYIPTNVISITDGQIFLEEELFHSGIRPAINAGLSVSRVAGAAQFPAMKTVAGQMRLEMAQFRELAVFTQFGTELDQATQQTLNRGARIQEILKQDLQSPMDVEDQIALYYLVTHGDADDVALEKIAEFEIQFLRYLRDRGQAIRNAIMIQGDLSPAIERGLRETIHEFKRIAWEAE